MNTEKIVSPITLIRSLKNDVTSASKAMGDGDHEEVERIYSHWTTGGRIDNNQQVIEESFSSREERKQLFLCWLAIGLLGLARIRIVDLNTQLKSSLVFTDKKIVLDCINDVHSTVYSKIPPENAYPETIHGASIDWSGEIAQDKGITLERMDKPDEALIIYSDAIEDLEARLLDLRSQRNGKIEKPTGKKKVKQEIATIFGRLPQIVDYQAEDKYEAAMLSALAVNKVRLGKLNHSTKLAWEGVLLQRSSMKQRSDESRMNDLTKMTAKISLENIVRIQTFPWAILALGFTGLKAYSELKIEGK